MYLSSVLRSGQKFFKLRNRGKKILKTSYQFEGHQKKIDKIVAEEVFGDPEGISPDVVVTPETVLSVSKGYSREINKHKKAARYAMMMKEMEIKRPCLSLLCSKMQLEIRNELSKSSNSALVSYLAEKFCTSPDIIQKVGSNKSHYEVDKLKKHDMKVLQNWNLFIKFGLKDVTPEERDIILEFYKECRKQIENTQYVQESDIPISKGPFGELIRKCMTINLDIGTKIDYGKDLVENFSSVEKPQVNKQMKEMLQNTKLVLTEAAQRKLKLINKGQEQSKQEAKMNEGYQNAVKHLFVEDSHGSKVDLSKLELENGVYKHGRDIYSEDGEYLYSLPFISNVSKDK